MNTFETKLFRLLNAADRIVVDGYEIESVTYSPEDIARLECDDDNEWEFKDQDVTVCNGVCQARILTSDADEPEEASIEFSVRRMIGPEDLSPDTP